MVTLQEIARKSKISLVIVLGDDPDLDLMIDTEEETIEIEDTEVALADMGTEIEEIVEDTLAQDHHQEARAEIVEEDQDLTLETKEEEE